MLLRHAVAEAAARGVPVRGIVEVGRTVDESLIHAAETRGVEVLLVGYSGLPGGRTEASEKKSDRVMHRLARRSHLGLVVAKYRKERTDSVLVPIGLEGRLRLVALVTRAIASATDAPLRFLLVAPAASREPDHAARVRARLGRHDLDGLGELEIVRSDDHVSAVAARAAAFDLASGAPLGYPGAFPLAAPSSSTSASVPVSAKVTSVTTWPGAGSAHCSAYQVRPPASVQ